VSGRHKTVNHENVYQTAMVGSFSSCGRQFFVAKSAETLDGGGVELPNKVIKEKPTPEASSAALRAEEDALTGADQKHIALRLTTRPAEERAGLGELVFSSPSDGGKSPRSICAAKLKQMTRSRKNRGAR
jgi:hypothetical protein